MSGALELSLPPVLPPLRRRLLLMRLVRARSPEMAHEQAVRLAAELERFLDELHNEEVELDRLDDLVPAELAEHWQESLTFLGLLRTAWPSLLEAEGRLEATRRRRLLLDALATQWRRTPARGRRRRRGNHRHDPGRGPAARDGGAATTRGRSSCRVSTGRSTTEPGRQSNRSTPSTA